MITEHGLIEAAQEHFAGRLPIDLPAGPPNEQTGSSTRLRDPDHAYGVWYPGLDGRPGVALTAMAPPYVFNGYLHDTIVDLARLSEAGLKPALDQFGVSVHLGQFTVKAKTEIPAGAAVLIYPAARVFCSQGNALLSAEAGGTPRLQYEPVDYWADPELDLANRRAALRMGRLLVAREQRQYLRSIGQLIGAYGVVEVLPEPLEDLAEHLEYLTSPGSLTGAALRNPYPDERAVSRSFWRNYSGLAEDSLERVFAQLQQRVEETPQRLMGLGLTA